MNEHKYLQIVPWLHNDLLKGISYMLLIYTTQFI